MPYIGRSEKFGVRTVFHFLASNGDTSVSGNDADGKALSFADGNYIDVYLNGVRLKSGEDYNTSTANTIAGLSALSANDEVNVVVYDAFSVADTVQASTGGTFSGAVTVTGRLVSDDTTEATSTTDGSLQTDGGLSVAKDAVIGGTVNVTGDTAAGDDASIGHTSAEGLILTGQGSTNDVTIKNDADTAVISIPTGTSDVNLANKLEINVDSGTQPSSYFNSFLNVQNNGATGSHASITVTSGSAGFAGLHFGDSDNGRIGQVAYDNDNNDLIFTSNNSSRWKIDSSGDLIPYATSAGIILGSTTNTAANTLDDFEEGNFDPTLKNETDTNLSVTYVDAYNHARYVKIGTIVFIQFTVNISALSGDSGSQNLIINNLPFTSKGYADNSNGGFNITYHVNFDTQPTFGMVLGSSTSLRFYSAPTTPLYSNALQSNSWFQGYGQYETDS